MFTSLHLLLFFDLLREYFFRISSTTRSEVIIIDVAIIDHDGKKIPKRVIVLANKGI